MPYDCGIRRKKTDAGAVAGTRVLTLAFYECDPPPADHAFTTEEDPMSKLSQAFAAFNPADPVTSVEACIENLLQSTLGSADPDMEPELDTSVVALTALAKKFLTKYAFAKCEKLAVQFLNYLAAKKPAIATEANALIAKLNSLAA